MIGDAGGGTVEFITFRVIRAKPLPFEQITQASGKKAGSLDVLKISNTLQHFRVDPQY